jgi:F0F1-type ATP synthase membrane subunit c/vacuolar-type H+-ATPase subunit K
MKFLTGGTRWALLVLIFSGMLCGCFLDNDSKFTQSYVDGQRLVGLAGAYNLIIAESEPGDALAFVERFSGPLPQAPATCEEQVGWVTCVASLLEKAASNPEYQDDMLDFMEEIAGRVDLSRPLCEEAQIARMETLLDVYSIISENPECATRLVDLFLNLLGAPGNVAAMSRKVAAARQASFAAVYQGILSEPAAEDELLYAADLLSGTMVYTSPIRDPLVQAGRLSSFAPIYRGVGNSPDLKTHLVTLALQLGGPTPNPAAFSNTVQASLLLSFTGVYEGIVRYGDDSEYDLFRVLEAVSDLAGNITYKIPITDTVMQSARLSSFSAIYEGIARRPDAESLLLNAADLLAGPLAPNKFLKEEEVQVARLLSFRSLYDGIARNPAVMDRILVVAEQLSGTVSSLVPLKGNQVQAARLSSFSSIYEGIARNPDFTDDMVSAALKLTGPASDPAWLSGLAHSDRLLSFAKVLEGIARNPEVEDQMMASVNILAGTILWEGPLHMSLQDERMTVLGSLFSSVVRQPEMTDELCADALFLLGPTPEGCAEDLSYQVQGARMAMLSTAYNYLGYLSADEQPAFIDLVEEYACKLRNSEE